LSCRVVDENRYFILSDLRDPSPVAVVKIFANRFVFRILDFLLMVLSVVEKLFSGCIDCDIPVRVVGISLAR
jgi:hypothetical protein